MPNPNEQAVGLAAGLTGLKARMLEVTQQVAGQAVTSEMQVVCISDAAGNIVGVFPDPAVQQGMLQELRAIRGLLARRNGELDLSGDIIQP